MVIVGFIVINQFVVWFLRVDSVGFNQSKADENSKTVLLTSMTAKQVNINTQAHTQLTGSLIAATDTGDKDGNTMDNSILPPTA
ncbi:hypothetical protein BSPWISOXPB_3732 [uncultured Gammaproteobacteria bacterium]|nr:hypothetical protein BSPWISOXPB_3732 [uncultured Gammaproteobacteria bacterium]